MDIICCNISLFLSIISLSFGMLIKKYLLCIKHGKPKLWFTRPSTQIFYRFVQKAFNQINFNNLLCFLIEILLTKQNFNHVKSSKIKLIKLDLK